MTTDSQQPTFMPLQASNKSHNISVLTSPRNRREKRKVDDHTQELTIGARLFVCKDAPEGQATFSRHATNALKALSEFVDEEPTLLGNQSLVQVNFGENDSRSQQPSKKSKIHRVASMPRLSDASSLASEAEEAKTSVQNFLNRMTTSASAPVLPALLEMAKHEESFISPHAAVDPDKHLHTILKSEGINVAPVSSLELKNYFLEMTDENIAAYGTDIISAVRQRDVDALRQMHKEGRMLQCCNRFGESVLHMACRRGSLDVVRFLVEEAGVSFCVRDDYGRTPLHDACWTREPEIELVKMIVTACPDLLLLKDKRGFTPLSYVRKDHWGQWCEFLEGHRGILTPNELLARSKQQ